MALTAKGKAAAQTALLKRVQSDERKKKQDAAKLEAVKSTSRTGSAAAKAAKEYVSALAQANKTRQVQTTTRTKNARQEAIERAERGALLGDYTITRNADGVTTITQSAEQKAAALSRVLDQLSEKQQAVLDEAIAANPDRVVQSARGFVEDSDLYKYIQAIQQATDAEGNVNLNINSKYTFNPYSDGQPDSQARRAFAMLSTADQLQLEIGSNGKPKTPTFGDPDADTGAYDRYMAALNKIQAQDKQREANAKYTAKQKEAEQKQEAEDAKAAKVRSEVEKLYTEHRGDWNYDAAAASKALAERFGVSQSSVSSIFDDLKSRYDYDDEAYAGAFRYKNLDASDPNALAKARGVSDAALAQTERGVYTPSAEGIAANVQRIYEKLQAEAERERQEKEAARNRALARHDPSWNTTAVDNADRYNRMINYELNEGIDNAEPWTYDSGKAYEEYYRRLDAGDQEGADKVLEDLRAEKHGFNSASAEDIQEAARRVDIVSGYEAAAKDSSKSWIDRLVSHQAAQYGKLTGRDQVDTQLQAVQTEQTEGKNQIAADVLNAFYASLKGAGDVLAGYANAAGHLMKEADALYRKVALGDDSEIKAGEFKERYPVTGWITDALLEAGDFSQSMDEKASTYLRASTGRSQASQAGTFVGSVAESVSNSAARMLSASVLPSSAWQTAAYMVESAGNTYDEMLDSGYTKMEAAEMAAWNACTEALIERYSDKILLSGGKSLQPLAKSLLGEGKLNRLIQAGSKIAGSRWGAAALRIFATGGFNEGVEEYIEYYTGQLGEKLVLGQTRTPTSNAEALRNAAMGAVCGTILSGLGCVADAGVQQKAGQMGDAIIRDGKTPSVEEVIDLASEVAEASAAEPASMSQMETAEKNGLALDATVRAAYQQATAEMTQAEQIIANGYAQLQQMNQQGVSPADPSRQQVVKSIAESVKARNQAAQKVSKTYAKILSSVDTLAAEADTAMQQRALAYQQQDEQLAQYKFARDAQSDPQGMVNVLTQQEAVLQVELARLQSELDGMPTGSSQARQAFATIQNLETAIAGVRELEQQAATNLPATPPTIAEEATSPDAGAIPAITSESVAPESSSVSQARQTVDEYRAQGATDEQIVQAAQGILNDAESDPADIAYAGEVLEIVRGAQPGIAQRYIDENRSRAKEGRVTDLLNIAQQESLDGNTAAANEAGLSAAREILANTGAVNYDGDMDADAQALWDRIRADNADYFAPGQQQAAPFAVPDFADQAVKVNKNAAAQWVRETEAAGTDAATIRTYAQNKRVTALTGKERHFWNNVAQQTQQPGQQDFRETADDTLARETIHLFDGSSPYVQATGLEMQHQQSTYPQNRSLASIKRDIQQIVGFTYSDEHYSGAARRRGAIAYYEPAHNFVSSSDTNNMTAFLHETGHAVNLESFSPDEVAVFRETMPADFIQQYAPEVQPAEAAAEMFRAWMLNPDSMEQLYPETFDGLRRSMGQRRYNRLKDQGNATRRFMDGDTGTRVTSVLADTRKKPRTPIQQTLRKAVQRVADSGYGYKKLDRAMQRAGVTLEAGGADARNAQARTSSEAISALYFDGMFDKTTGQRVAPALSETVQNIRTEEEMNALNVYLELKQALDRYEADNNDWIFSRDVCTVAQARAYVQDVERNRANVVESAQNLWGWLRAYRDTQLSDAIPQDVKNQWESRNPHYIPQTRQFTADIQSAVRGGGIGGQGTGVNRRGTGSTRDIVSPVDAIANMVARTKTAAMKHDVLVALEQYYDADTDGTAGAFLHEIDPQQVPHTVSADVIRRQAEQAFANAGMSEQDVEGLSETLRENLEDGVVFEIRQPGGGRGNAFAVTRDGQTRYFEVHDQDLLNAMVGMSPKETGAVLSAVKKVSHFTNSLITAKNPAFALGNAARDFQEAYFTGSEQNPVLFTRDYLQALWDVVRNQESAQQYKAMGGSGGLSSVYATAKDVNDLKRAMFGSAGDNRNAAQKALDGLNNAIEAFNGSIETVPRLAEYKRQLRRGASYADAIKAAKNCTTDFSTHGSAAAVDGALWRFYNASVQSTYKAANLFVDGSATPQNRARLARQLASMVTFGVAGRALAEILLQLNDEDDTYAAMPEYIKDSYWIIPTGQKGKYIRIPLPNGALMTTVNALGRRIGLAAMGIKDKQDVGDVLGEQAAGLLMDVIGGLSPVGEINGGNPLGSNFAMNIAFQVGSNTSWTGAPIVPSSMEGLSPALQYNEKTSGFARLAGSVLNVSPLKVDYILSQNSGVIGEINDAVTAGMNKAESDGALAGVGEGIKEFFLSRFLVDTAYSQGVTSAFYDQRTALQTFIDDVDGTMDRDGLPYSPVFRDLSPQQTAQARQEAQSIKKKMDALSKQLSELGQLATQAAARGDEEKARSYRFNQQRLAAEASVDAANFFDKWKHAND